MPHIRQLESHVADLIAAGEVVERPASVVKELVENAIDAGCSAVAVEIRRGGMGLIRVTDNGCGIAPEELPTAFLRHATSKLRTPEDLGCIGTLGFRGEALAAISAVSRVEVLTRQRGAARGAALRLEGGVPEAVEEAGAPEGTTVSVRDLFFNTPARLKFMRKDSAETAAVAGLMQHLALSHPSISFKFIKDGTESLHTPGDGKLSSAVYAALGRDFAKGLVSVEGRGGETAVSGFVTAPLQGRGSRSMQVFFVNGRFVKSQLLTAALEEGYRNQLMKGKFPGCVIHLTVRPGEVDVNVHPTKTEVKFQREQAVFTTVYGAVAAALERDHTRPQASIPGVRPSDTVSANQTALPLRDGAGELAGSRFMPSARFKPLGGTVPGGQPQPSPPPRPEPASPPESPGQPVKKKKDSPFQWVEPLPEKTETPAGAEPSAPVKPKPAPPVSAPAREEPPAPSPAPAEAAAPEPEPWVVRGELFHTYVVVEQGDKALLIDKHAAHERANFDRLKAADYRPMVQELLTPAAFSPSPEELEILLAQGELLARFGFEVERFGGNALAVRSAPDYLDAGEIEGALCELARRLRVTGCADPAAARDELLHTMACKAAVKGGWRSGREELEEVAGLVMSGQVKYCPHGRPVAIELTKRQLEKQFRRA